MTGGTVVILGETGRNFAAGMSGGIAYVYDVKGTFPERCNTEMVDLTAPDPEDFETVRKFIGEHHRLTGSTVAKFLLEDMDNQRGHFVKVFPRDYRAALERRAGKPEAMSK
jgi:glutamate synthase (NADPH/NADH) large chain